MFGRLTILGADDTADVGDLLQARTNDVVKDWRDLDSGSQALQWLRDGIAIPGAVASTYRVQDADRGHTITLRYDFRVRGKPHSVDNVDPVAVPMPDGFFEQLYLKHVGAIDPVGLAWWKRRITDAFIEAANRDRAQGR